MEMLATFAVVRAVENLPIFAIRSAFMSFMIEINLLYMWVKQGTETRLSSLDLEIIWMARYGTDGNILAG